MKSGVIFLDRSDHIEIKYYNKQKGTSYWNAASEALGLSQTAADDSRRVNILTKLLASEYGADASYLDVGCGLGGVLRGMKESVNNCFAIEPQDEMRGLLVQSGYDVFSSFADLPEGKTFDLVTLFHVFEHLTEPATMLTDIYKVMKPGGTLIIEVPHARDALLQTFDLGAFKKFTFWSEHMVLHTQQSLKSYLESSGFRDVRARGMQRYPLANHLYWLWKGEPGGDKKLSALRDERLEEEYERLLVSLDQTDTLWIEGRR